MHDPMRGYRGAYEAEAKGIRFAYEKLQKMIQRAMEEQKLEESRKVNKFELAGYTREQSEELMTLCQKSGIPYDTMIAGLGGVNKIKDFNRLRQAMEETNPLSQYSTTQLKQELRRRKGKNDTDNYQAYL